MKNLLCASWAIAVTVPPTGIDLGNMGAMLLPPALVALLALAGFVLNSLHQRRK